MNEVANQQSRTFKAEVPDKLHKICAYHTSVFKFSPIYSLWATEVGFVLFENKHILAMCSVQTYPRPEYDWIPIKSSGPIEVVRCVDFVVTHKTILRGPRR